MNDSAIAADAWTDIARYIPRDKKSGAVQHDGGPRSLESSEQLRALGFDVVAAPYDPETGANDFFASEHGDIVISNPPFTRKRDVLRRVSSVSRSFSSCGTDDDTGYFRGSFYRTNISG